MKKEFIFKSLGVLLAISTMAAAGLGHIVADVAGIGLSHYVQFLASKTRVKHPVLTAEQVHYSSLLNAIKKHLLVKFVVLNQRWGSWCSTHFLSFGIFKRLTLLAFDNLRFF